MDPTGPFASPTPEPVVGAPKPPKPARPAKPLAKRVVPPRPVLSAVVVLGFVGLLYVVEGIDTVLGGRLNDDGVIPRDFSEWDNIIWFPFLHGDWTHLTGNAVPLLVLAYLATSGGIKQFFQITAVIWLTSGLGVWIFGAYGSHIGASGLVFGFLVFLLVRGIFARSPLQIVLAVVVFAMYGAALWGVLPGQPGISWEGHLFGALGGVLAAWGVARDARKNAGTTLNA
ncbi:rhomboid family intramembrane serine protease [Saccharothrix deserti]|uniref:rhomboid family intramembrane serine protease n=1 Tax=Saccharothrix deserti TaxID=2593674 RepID=UPI003B75BAE2